jgi:isopenicillin N synthase-like dioxygenase
VDDKKTHGVEATNQEYTRYDQVRKEQQYRLSDAGDAPDAYDEQYRIRTVDIGRFLNGSAADRKTFARELGEALRGIGFAILEGHPIDPRLYDEAAERIEEFYTSVPLEEKLRFKAARHGSVNQGYFAMRETSDIHPDLVEGWVFCRRAFALDAGRAVRLQDFWPRPELEPFFRRLCLQHEALILPVMQSILMDLGCHPHLYDRRLTATNFGLRLNYYPPLSEADEASGAARILGHEDVDLFTFLPAPAIEGLQVLNRASMKWVRLDAPRGTIVLNTGDYMQRISNDILPSTTHRVVKPRDPALRRRARVSFPMAVYVWEDELLEVLPGLGEPRYAPVRALQFHTATTSKFYGDDYAVP